MTGKDLQEEFHFLKDDNTLIVGIGPMKVQKWIMETEWIGMFTVEQISPTEVKIVRIRKFFENRILTITLGSIAYPECLRE